MIVTEQGVVGPFIKSRILTVHNFAFVVPVYDYDEEDTMDFAPACDSDCVGYQVFAWTGEAFEPTGELYDDVREARTDAENLHSEWVKRYEIKTTKGTEYYVEQIPEFDEDGNEIPSKDGIHMAIFPTDRQ